MKPDTKVYIVLGSAIFIMAGLFLASLAAIQNQDSACIRALGVTGTIYTALMEIFFGFLMWGYYRTNRNHQA